ncbi:hypothetical protein, partial [Mesorhizobium sp.]
ETVLAEFGASAVTPLVRIS